MTRKPFNWHGLIVFLVAGISIGLDQFTKAWVRANIPIYTSWNPITWLEPIVTLTHLENSGAAFGLFQGMSIVFVFIALGVIVGVMIFYRHLAESSLFLRIAFGLQLGGAMGNLIDRLLFNGIVTDFIDVHIWPIFNVADSSVVVGTALLAYYALYLDREAPEEAMEEGDANVDNADVAASPDLSDGSSR